MKWFKRALCLVIGILPVHPSLSSAQTAMHWYAGDTHVHTAIHAISSIDKRVEEGLEGGLDWVAITRHERSGAYWKADEVDRATERMGHKIMPILGVEWDEPPQLGQEDIILLGVNRYAPIPRTSLQAIIDYANNEGGLFIFAHPSPFVFENIHKWKAYTAFEGHSGGRWNPACEAGAAWDQMLMQGDRIFIVGASDNHNQPYLGERIVKTYVHAQSTNPGDILDGIRAGRVFVSERDQSQMTFQLNGGEMGGTVRPNNGMLYATITATGEKPITSLKLIGNGKVLWTNSPEKAAFSDTIRLVASETLRYIRLVVETEDARAMSNPIFITQEGDLTKQEIIPQQEHPLARWRAYVKTAPEAKYEAQAVLMSQVLTPEATDGERMTAAYGLIDLDLPDADRALIRLAADTSTTVRAYAARMMATRGMAVSDTTLQRLLSDDDPRVRLWAVRTLERQTGRSLPGLIEMVDDEAYWVHYAAMEGLLDLAQTDASVYEKLTDLALSGHMKMAELFSWAPEREKQAVIRYYTALNRMTPSPESYQVLERLGASPAKTYKMSADKILKPLVLDGKPDDTFWKTNEKALYFVQDNMDSLERLQTSVKVGYDDARLYFLFTCPVLSQQDQDAEYVFIGFDTNHNGGIDYTFEINKNGQVNGEKDGLTAWDAEINVQIGLTGKTWIAEVAIPYTALEWKGNTEQKVWGINLSHGIRGQNARLSSWAPTLGQLSNAQRYGDLLFE